VSKYIYKILKRSILLFALMLSITAFGQNSMRVVSLAPSLTNMLTLLEVPQNIVGCTSYCDVPKGFSPRVVATAVSVSIEEVFALRPDLVITSSLTQPGVIEKLKSLGLNVMVFHSPVSYQGINDQFRQIAKLVNRTDFAEKVIAEQNRRVEKLKAKLRPDYNPRVFFQLGSKPLFTVIPGTFMDDFITMAGGSNIAYGLKGGTISRETVLARNPDVIIIVTMGVAADEEVAGWKRFGQISAVQNNKIMIVDAEKAASPNPVFFVDVLEEIIEFISQ
jgi:iron complex transport system substrate-binding protein